MVRARSPYPLATAQDHVGAAGASASLDPWQMGARGSCPEAANISTVVPEGANPRLDQGSAKGSTHKSGASPRLAESDQLDPTATHRKARIWLRDMLKQRFTRTAMRGELRRRYYDSSGSTEELATRLAQWSALPSTIWKSAAAMEDRTGFTFRLSDLESEASLNECLREYEQRGIGSSRTPQARVPPQA